MWTPTSLNLQSSPADQKLEDCNLDIKRTSDSYHESVIYLHVDCDYMHITYQVKS